MYASLPTRGISRASLLILALCAGCAGATPSATPSPNPPIGSGAPMPGASPLVQGAWPTRTREHLDLWLHSYALINDDTTLVPYFDRGYRDRILTVRRQRGFSSQLDANRNQLRARIGVQPSLATSGQFLPLYFESWDQMRQAISLFVGANGNPASTNDPNLRMYFAILGSAFQSAPDREWLRTFTAAVEDETRFYHDYWTSQNTSHRVVIGHVDSLWQLQWRPALQRFLNNTQQQNGELYMSAPLGGEGRTVHFGKGQNAVAGPLPDALGESEIVLYVMAHEITGTIASAAIQDNTTPADLRAGRTSRYEQAAAVRAGAMLLEKTIPAAVPGYMRYYLQATGRTAPTDPRSAFISAYPIPDAVREAIARQFDTILGGI